MSFIYVTKNARRTKTRKDADVIVSYVKIHGGNYPTDLKFSFSEAIKEKAFKNVEYLVCAYDKEQPTRIWFSGDASKIGYKLFNPKSKGTRFIFQPSGLAKIVKDPAKFAGDYELKYALTEKMWFIEKEPEWMQSLRELQRETMKGNN